MELSVALATAVLVFIIVYQQNYITRMKDKVFHALKITCETLDLIKNDCTLEDILEFGKKSTKTKSK